MIGSTTTARPSNSTSATLATTSRSDSSIRCLVLLLHSLSLTVPPLLEFLFLLDLLKRPLRNSLPDGPLLQILLGQDLGH